MVIHIYRWIPGVRAAVVAEKGRGRKKPKPIAAGEAADAAGMATAAVDVFRRVLIIINKKFYGEYRVCEESYRNLIAKAALLARCSSVLCKYLIRQDFKKIIIIVSLEYLLPRREMRPRPCRPACRYYPRSGMTRLGLGTQIGLFMDRII